MDVTIKAGRYELLEELGHGAMGVVYKAHDPVLGRTVAVKMIRLTAGGAGMPREELISRFRKEARAAGSLTHPNIVAVHDAGEQDGLIYIVMELIEGRSLQAELDPGRPLPLTRGLHIVEQVCSALEFAHQRRIVHRDIKPANLMLTADDVVKVTDFGTAKMLELGTVEQSQIVGTPSYMSPEQVKGKPIDGRSDIFALGVVLYELVTGKRPFPGENITTVIYKIVNEEPVSPRQLEPTVHPGLSNVILRALAKEPTARFQNCREFLEALQNYKTFAPGAGTTIVIDRRPPSETTIAFTPPSVQIPEPPRQLSSVGNFFFAVLLLAIIGGAGYKVWPVVHDVWLQIRTRIVEHTPPPTLAKLPPPVTPTSPEKVPATNASLNPIPAAPSAAPAKKNASSGNAAAPKVQPVTPKPAHKTGETPKIDPHMMELKGRLEEELDRSNLSDKVQVRLDGSALVLTGRLGPVAHQRLMRQVEQLSTDVKIVDNIEYASESAGAMESIQDLNGKCLLVVGSNPPGAEVYVDGKPTGLVTPARIRLEPGRHAVRLNLAGHEPVRRIIQAQADRIERLNPTIN